tara:strand:+ start:313 stop:1212 length:900 start_codon:yes stop_codon:yes gene_type:complete
MTLPIKSGALAPTNMGEAIQFSEMLASSNMVPKNFQGKPADILVAVQWGSEVGLSPLAALNGICIIQGKPSLYGDSALALVVAHPAYGGHEEKLEGEEASCTIVRIVNGKEITTVRTFSVTDAKKANLMSKPGPWSQYPKRMLAMRARGFAMRDAFPDALKGVITYEEALDIPDEAIKDITPANPLDATFAPEVEAIKPPEFKEEEETRNWELVSEQGVQEFPTVSGWKTNFQMQLNTIDSNGAKTFTARRHDCAEYKKANDDTISRIEIEEPDEHKYIKAFYTKLIKRLSAKIKENGE